MKTRMKKTASGMSLNNSSPAAIEERLINLMKEDLGEWKDAVTIKPFLKIEDDDADMSGNVKNAFGALQLNVHGVKLYVPFMIVDKTLLPFDTIRMGEEEVSYDHAKLRRIVNGIEHKKKSQAEEGSNDGDSQFNTMEIASFDDVQPNNGFLGTIMTIRDNHRAKDMNGHTPWTGQSFGEMDDQRLMRRASVDVFDTFHEVMEKVAEVKVYSESQMKEFHDHLYKKALEEAEDEMEKVAAGENRTLEQARVEKDMVALSEAKLFNVHRAASGNNISFPTFFEGRFSFNRGRIYKKFANWFKNANDYRAGKHDAIVLDSKGGYALLRRNQPFMASVETPKAFEMKTELARGLKKGLAYTAEKDEQTLFPPFYVDHSYVDDELNDGIVISVRERSTADEHNNYRIKNSLFRDVLKCKEIIPGKTTYGGGQTATVNQPFIAVISRDATITEPLFLSEKELEEYIMNMSRDTQDAQLARSMFMYMTDVVLLPENYPFFKLEKNIKDYYTRPDGIFTEGAFSKEASFNNQNKARLVVESKRNPKTYTVQWQFIEEADAGGVSSERVERREKAGLSEDQAKAFLAKLGYDHRDQAKFFEVAKRNGTHAIFELKDPARAAEVHEGDVASSRAKEKMKQVAEAMLHSRNFTPVFEDAIAGGLATVISEEIPGSIEATHKIGDLFNMRHAYEVATEMEKKATDFNGESWHEISALLNLKYNLDKLAEEVNSGGYLHNAEPVFEKVEDLKPAIEKRASELIQFNREQLTKVDRPLIQPELIKSALHEFDGLYTYASVSDSLKKKYLNS